ncbi:MAG: hypothetical protein HC881_05485 [Leptolyngbyaceae cyanobacterium SL_7_1]|nr:hypothetical protein [Leptolyngbyaceae cyanobacterium SL_7_1]
MTESTQSQQPPLEFDSLLKQAIAQPAEADLKKLWQWLDLLLEYLPQDKVLRVAGEAIAQLAIVCANRAALLLEEWQLRYDDSPVLLEEPVLSDELLTGILRHTMSLNLEDLIEEVDPQHRQERSPSGDSVVAGVDKEAVLAMVDQLELKQLILQTAYTESVSNWSTALHQWIELQPQPVGLEAVLSGIEELSPVQVWLGLLLSDSEYQWQHRWETDEEFYRPSSISLIIQPCPTTSG